VDVSAVNFVVSAGSVGCCYWVPQAGGEVRVGWELSSCCIVEGVAGGWWGIPGQRLRGGSVGACNPAVSRVGLGKAANLVKVGILCQNPLIS
jgi:hypothetical protein